MILLLKNETFKKGDETKGFFSRFFNFLEIRLAFDMSKAHIFDKETEKVIVH